MSPLLLCALPMLALLQAEETAVPSRKPAGVLVIQPEVLQIYSGDAVPLRWRFTNGLTVPMEISSYGDVPSAGEVTWTELDPHGPPMVAFPRSAIPESGPSALPPMVAAGATFTSRTFLNRFFPALPVGMHRLSWTQTIHCGYSDPVMEEMLTCTGEFTIDIHAGKNPNAQKLAQDLYQSVLRGDEQSPGSLSWLCFMDTPEIIPQLRSFVELGHNRLVSGEPFEAIIRLCAHHEEAQRLFEDVLRSQRFDLIGSGLQVAFDRHELIPLPMLRNLLASPSDAIVEYTIHYLEMVIAAASKERVKTMLDGKALPLDDIAALMHAGRCTQKCTEFLSMIHPPPPAPGPSPATEKEAGGRQPAAAVDIPIGRPDPAANSF